MRGVIITEEGKKWIAEEDADIEKTIKKFRDKGEEFENLKPEDGFTEPPWKK